MKLWRVSLSIHLEHILDTEPHPIKYTVHPCTFYVHAVSASDARTKAIKLVSAGVHPATYYRTSGSVIAVDGNLEPLDPSCVSPSYDSWDDSEQRSWDNSLEQRS